MTAKRSTRQKERDNLEAAKRLDVPAYLTMADAARWLGRKQARTAKSWLRSKRVTIERRGGRDYVSVAALRQAFPEAFDRDLTMVREALMYESKKDETIASMWRVLRFLFPNLDEDVDALEDAVRTRRHELATGKSHLVGKCPLCGSSSRR